GFLITFRLQILLTNDQGDKNYNKLKETFIKMAGVLIASLTRVGEVNSSLLIYSFILCLTVLLDISLPDIAVFIPLFFSLSNSILAGEVLKWPFKQIGLQMGFCIAENLTTLGINLLSSQFRGTKNNADSKPPISNQTSFLCQLQRSSVECFSSIKKC